jgi:uncharacterized protein (DUF2252 family)
MTNVRKAFAAYRETLSEHRRVLLDRFKLMDVAVKVVGVGSVGTFCAVMLLMASETDPLFLQVKEARPSVLEAYAGKSLHANHGQRIVAGCQLMQFKDARGNLATYTPATLRTLGRQGRGP